MFSEHVEFTFELMKQRIRFFADRKVFNLNEASNEITLGDDQSQGEHSTLLDFFQQMAQPYLDSYLLVLLAIEQLCGKNIVVKVRNLVKELHSTAQDLYAEKIYPHLHSCLQEILFTALERFE